MVALGVFHAVVEGGVEGVQIDDAYQKHQLTAARKDEIRTTKAKAGRLGGQQSGAVRRARSRSKPEADVKHVLHGAREAREANGKQTRSKPEALSLSPSLDQEQVAPDGARAADADARGVDALVDLWNTGTTSPLPQCQGLSPKRRAAARARLRERPSLAEWTTIIARIQASPFCRGGGERGWIMDFTFLVKPDTALHVLEGKYDDHAQATTEQRFNNAVDKFERSEGRAATDYELAKLSRSVPVRRTG
jgi:hypothetical protein